MAEWKACVLSGKLQSPPVCACMAVGAGAVDSFDICHAAGAILHDQLCTLRKLHHGSAGKQQNASRQQALSNI